MIASASTHAHNHQKSCMLNKTVHIYMCLEVEGITALKVRAQSASAWFALTHSVLGYLSQPT